MKIIPKENLSPECFDKIINELEVMKKVDHPSIVKFHCAFINGPNIYIVMQLCEGRELVHRLKM